MVKEEFTKEILEKLLDELKKRGFNIKAVSSKIGFDDRGVMMANAKRGTSEVNLKNAIVGIRKEFAEVLLMDPIADEEVVTLRTINEKLNRILSILESKEDI